MIKKIVKSLFVCTLFVLTINGVYADQSRILDGADLFTTEEEMQLQSQAEAMSTQIGGDVVIITTQEAYTGVRDYYIEDMYFEQGFGTEGVVLHIDMYNREVWVQVFGEFDDTMDADDRDELFYLVKDELSSSRYYQGGVVFIENIPSAMNGTIRFGLGSEFILVVIVAGAIFASIYLSVKTSYARVGSDKPYPFREKASMQLAIIRDDFTREYVTKVRKPKSSSSGGGGGGGASRSSGRSSSSSGGKF